MKTLARDDDQPEMHLRMRALRPESVRRWGRMSVHEMVCHLSDSFRMVSEQKQVSHASGPLRRTIVKWIALFLPVPWPAGLVTRPELDQEVGGTRPVDFAADVAELEALLDRITTRKGSFDGRSHPIFGAMSEASWLRWGYLHMDHHLRQFGR